MAKGRAVQRAKGTKARFGSKVAETNFAFGPYFGGRPLVDRVTIFQKEMYRAMRDVSDCDPVTANKYRDLLHAVHHNLWQLCIQLKKSGGLGQDLPWAA